MARLLSSTRFLLNHHKLHPPPTTFLSRQNSSKTAPHLIEIDLGETISSSESVSSEILLFEDLVYKIMAHKSAPSWLPFIPGSSYWVPPRPEPYSVAKVLNQLVHPKSSINNSVDFGVTAQRGWPSSSYFIEDAGNESMSPEQVEMEDSNSGSMEVQVEVVRINPGDASCAEDEEE